MAEGHYDYVIAGGGLAGLSLAFRLNRSGLRDRRVAVIDRAEKSANDHTWCFWSDRSSEFDEIVFHKWKSLWFHGPAGSSKLLEIGEEGLEYRMIRASDFYAFVIAEIAKNPAFDVVQAEIAEVSDGEVFTDRGIFTASDFVFDSVTLNSYDDPADHNLLQHFLGWVIETEDEVFDPSAATLFDFRVPQHDDCRFIYILPESRRRSLVEYTVFSGSLLDRAEYERELSSYIRERLCPNGFRTVEEEFGVIPMSDTFHHTRPSPKVVRIGTAGGFVKPSTGYSFTRTQERLAAIVAGLETSGDVSVPATGAWKSMLDSVMLSVLESGSARPADVFDALFTGNPPGRVLRFLDERSGLLDDLKVMRSVPLAAFTRAFGSEVLRRVRRKAR